MSEKEVNKMDKAIMLGIVTGWKHGYDSDEIVGRIVFTLDNAGYFKKELTDLEQKQVDTFKDGEPVHLMGIPLSDHQIYAGMYIKNMYHEFVDELITEIEETYKNA